MNGDERGELSALRAEVRALTSAVDKLSVIVATASKVSEDHEMRLRDVERWKSALPVSTLIFLGTTAIALVGLFIKG